MTRLVSYLAFFRVVTLAFAQDCYWPNGDKAPSAFKPCNNKAGTCCYRLDDAHTDLCYDNGLCYSAFWGNVYRGACTSQSWDRNSGCASNCLTFIPGGESPVSPCADRSLCCGAAENVTSCCDNKSGFIWRNATLISSLSSSASQSSKNSSPSSTSSSDASSSSQNAGNPDSSSSKSSDNSSETAIKVGLGTALGLSLATILVLVIMLVGQRRRRDQPIMLSDGPTAARRGGGGGGVQYEAKPLEANLTAPWVYGHEASSMTETTEREREAEQRPQSPVMLSDSEMIHELDSNRRTWATQQTGSMNKTDSVRHTVHSIAGSDAPSVQNT